MPSSFFFLFFTRVGDGDGAVREEFHQIVQNPAPLPLVLDPVHQKLGAVLRQLRQAPRRHRKRSVLLPPVCDHVVSVVQRLPLR